MLYRSVLIALFAAATVAALPWTDHARNQARAVTPTGRKKYLGAKFSPKTTAANALKKKKGKGNKGNAGNAGAGNNNNNGAGGAANNGTAANAVGDTGILDVVELCQNPDGKTDCFEILGDSKDSCFTIPNPIANDVQFFTPSPNNTCSLFSDEDCTQNETAADGVIADAKQNSWACTPIVAAAAAA